MPSKEAGEMAKLVEAIRDLKSHRDAWRNAIALAKSVQSDDVLYWEHELKVFDRTFDILVGKAE